MPQAPDLQDVREACLAFPGRFKTLHLATLGRDGEPEASYAPYVADQGRYYVFLSELARHTSNLRESGRCSVLFIESEDEAKHLFARQRLTLLCQARVCARDDRRFEAVMDAFTQRFGRFMDVIRPLQDFHLFELQPLQGAYVAGFARAYTLGGDDLGELRHRNDAGHRTPDGAASQRLQEELAP